MLEPSCAAALRSDLPNLLPHDARARQPAERVRTLAEILDPAQFGIDRPETTPAIVQPHCHQQAILGTSSDRMVLDRSGIDVTEMLTGCCGLAGSFGMEKAHADMSRAVAGLSLLPALARTSADTVVIADGVSCRTQIESVSGRRAIHTAELLAQQLRGRTE